MQLRRRDLPKTLALVLPTGIAGVGFRQAEKGNRVPIGFNLVSWGSNEHDTWKKAVSGVNSLGVREVTIVTYRFVDRRTGAVFPTSRYGLEAPPSDEVISEAMRWAKQLGMSVSLNPFAEVDNPIGIGSSWRGNLDYSETELAAFFLNYGEYIESMAHIARTTGADRLYVGSELAALSRNPKATSFWTGLIQKIRAAVNTDELRLSYAANHDEVETVPFWDDLDEIGVDAYFSLATREEAEGLGKPPTSTIIATWKRHLDHLRKFGRIRSKPVIISEWGSVPLDLTTYQPWNWRPSEVADATEQLDAYRATLEATKYEGDWLAGVNFWHWRMPGNEASSYAVTANSALARLIGDFARRE